MIARAHQLVQEGYKYMFDEQLVTVWSAPNYCYRCGNMASIMTVHEDGSRTFTVYDAAAENDRDKGQGRRIVSLLLPLLEIGLLKLLSRRVICRTLYDTRSFIFSMTILVILLDGCYIRIRIGTPRHD